jgi:hypothetical protein
MANEVLQKVGTQICFADHAADWAGGTAKTSLEQGTPTDVQLDLTSLADGSGRESAKFDFGATRAAAYNCMASIETVGATSKDTVDMYLAESPDSVAANGNPGQIDGVDAAAPSGVGTLDELLPQCQHIGSLSCENTANTVQTGKVGVVTPGERYGILIVVNESGGALLADAVEHHVVFDPIVDEIQ